MSSQDTQDRRPWTTYHTLPNGRLVTQYHLAPTANLLKHDLLGHFADDDGDVRFSVRSRPSRRHLPMGMMGVITVRWSDGPSVPEVTAVGNRYLYVTPAEACADVTGFYHIYSASRIIYRRDETPPTLPPTPPARPASRAKKVPAINFDRLLLDILRNKERQRRKAHA